MSDLAGKIPVINLTRGSLLARNTVLNLVGQGVPLLVGICAIPLVIEGMGTDRFGMLTLIWSLIGYFNLFDLGLGRALVKFVSERLGRGKHEEIDSLVWTYLTLMLMLGLLGSMIVIFLSPWFINDVIKIPETLRRETIHAFYLIGVSLPLVISTTGLRGLLESRQRFDIVNAIRIPIGVAIFLGPLFVLPFSRSLFSIVGVLVAIRLIDWFVHLISCFYIMPSLRQTFQFRRTLVWPLIHFGGWLTVSNIVGPLLLYTDRFLIGSLISVTAVAYYTVPYEIVTKFLIVPSSVVGVLFPAFGVCYAQKSKDLLSLYKKAMKSIFLGMLIVVFATILLSREGLTFWLSEEFAAQSFRVAQLLVVGVAINSLGLISQALIQAGGRPDLTAKLHLIEFPLYLIYLWWLLHLYGIQGAALAWVVRVTISALALAFMAHRSILKKIVV